MIDYSPRSGEAELRTRPMLEYLAAAEAAAEDLGSTHAAEGLRLLQALVSSMPPRIRWQQGCTLQLWIGLLDE